MTVTVGLIVPCDLSCMFYLQHDSLCHGRTIPSSQVTLLSMYLSALLLLECISAHPLWRDHPDIARV